MTTIEFAYCMIDVQLDDEDSVLKVEYKGVDVTELLSSFNADFDEIGRIAKETIDREKTVSRFERIKDQEDYLC